MKRPAEVVWLPSAAPGTTIPRQRLPWGCSLRRRQRAGASLATGRTVDPLLNPKRRSEHASDIPPHEQRRAMKTLSTELGAASSALEGATA